MINYKIILEEYQNHKSFPLFFMRNNIVLEVLFHQHIIPPVKKLKNTLKMPLNSKRSKYSIEHLKFNAINPHRKVETNGNVPNNTENIKLYIKTATTLVEKIRQIKPKTLAYS